MPHWSWYATGPCHGIQTGDGRLLVACDHVAMVQKRRHVDPYHSHVVYSDDGGETWHIGGVSDEGTNESVVVEAEDGRICLNSRNKYSLPGGGNFRAVSWSHNRGGGFSPLVHDAFLPEPICQGSMARLSTEQDTGRSRVLFSNPASLSARIGMTVRLSYDDCRTWPVARRIHEGPSAYSDLCIAADGSICLLYERGGEGPYEWLTFARFSLEWLTAGADSLNR
jgi:sialidase-1